MFRAYKSRRGMFAIVLVLSMLALSALACGIGGNQPAEPTAAPLVNPTDAPTAAPTDLPAPTLAPVDTKAPSDTSGGGTTSDITLDIENNSSTDVCYLYVSLSTDSEWGQDQLGNDTVPSNTVYTLSDIPAGTYDLRADDCSNNTLAQEYGVEFASGPYTWTFSDTTGVSLHIINNSSLELCYLYVSSSDSTDWGPDQLGDSTVPAGSDFTISGIEPGTYDMRAEACDGSELEEYGLDLSGDFEYTITD